MGRTKARVVAAASAVAAALVAGLVPVTAGAGQTAVGSPSGGDPYFPRDGNGGYQVVDYRIRDTYDPATDRLRGTTVLRARATEDLDAFHLDLVLAPDAVWVDGRRASYSRPNRHELRVEPAQPLAAGDAFTVEVRYAGRPASVRAVGVTPGVDLFFRATGGGPAETVAMGEPQNGPWWFAANETPEDKATYTVTIRVPRGLQAVGNGALVRRERQGPWTAWTWRAREPMVSYGAFFAAGRFTLERSRVDGRAVVNAVSHRLGGEARRRSLRLLRRTPEVVRWLERRFGRYPFATTGGLVSGADVGYALETQTRPVYPFSGGPGPSGTGLVVHEIAHQWFGNDVSLRRWRDVWLNEGFATYAEWLWLAGHGGPTVDARLRDEYDARGAGAAFWDVPLTDPGASRIWTAPVYIRGAMTLAALRNRIGVPAVRALLREWAARGARGHGTTADFIALAEEVSGQDLDGFFTAWLATPDKPAATATHGLP